MTVLKLKYTVIPINKKSTFTTYRGKQSGVIIKVFLGEFYMFKNCQLLGKFKLEGIPPAPCGTPQIEVILDHDFNGIFKVPAIDKASGRDVKITITNDVNTLYNDIGEKYLQVC